MPTRSPKRPRRRAKQERARQTVEAVLEAGARLLQRRGYAGTTTNHIAETAGVSVGTLYEYFADKDEIFDTLIRRQIEEIVAAVRSEDLVAEAPLGATLERILRLGMGAMGRGPGFIRALEQVPGSVFRRRLADGRLQVIGFVRELLWARRKELRVMDLDIAAFVVVSAAEGIASNASDELFGEQLAVEVSSLLNLYLTGEE